MVSLRVEGTQKHRRVNCDVVYYYEEGAAAPTDDDYEETCEHSSTREVAQWCAETRVLEAGDDDDDLAALRALKDRAAAAGRAAFLRAQRLEPPPPPPRKADVPAVGAHLARRDDASVKGVAGRVDVHDNGHAWIDLQTIDGDLHRVRSTQVVAATLSPAEVARCGKTLSPEQWLEKRLDSELKVTVAGGRVVGNSFVDGAGAKRRQFVVAGDRGGLVRCALCDWTAAPRLCVKIADLRTDKEAWRKLMHAIKSHAGFFPSTREGNTHVAALQRALATVAPRAGAGARCGDARARGDGGARARACGAQTRAALSR